MQIDFHYYCVGVLARAAGFNKEDALTIAYASQYVDDSTEGELLRVQINGTDFSIDPVRTSYSLLESIASRSWSAQKRVWIPFHFIPPKPFKRNEPFSFVTESNSEFAQLLLDQAAKEPLKNYEQRLCRIGVALHTYADSWSHQGFSGRHNRTENDVKGIRSYDRDKDEWESPQIENILFTDLPYTGHAQAAYFPDLAFQKWECTIESEQNEIGRDNIEWFLSAAKVIYDKLEAMKKKNPLDVIPWDQLKERIGRSLESPGKIPEDIGSTSMVLYRAMQALRVERRCEVWKEEFSDLFEPHPEVFSYDTLAWRKQAGLTDTNWDDFTLNDWTAMPPQKVAPDFWDSLWMNFHNAALRQRHLVLEKLP